MGVRGIPRTHLIDGGGEQISAVQNVCVLCKEQEDQACHKMVHFMAAIGGAPFGVVLQQLNIKPIEATSGLDVKGALTDLLDGADPRQGQEETKVIRKVGVGAGNCFACGQVFGFKVDAIGGKDEFGLSF